RAYAPDVVIFPDIGMDRFTQAVASVRHAPVQVTTWGHPVTSGMPTIDFFLSADACAPEEAGAHYTEKLVRLPRLGAYLGLPAAATVRPYRARSPTAQAQATARAACSARKARTSCIPATMPCSPICSNAAPTLASTFFAARRRRAWPRRLRRDCGQRSRSAAS